MNFVVASTLHQGSNWRSQMDHIKYAFNSANLPNTLMRSLPVLVSLVDITFVTINHWMKTMNIQLVQQKRKAILIKSRKVKRTIKLPIGNLEIASKLYVCFSNSQLFLLQFRFDLLFRWYRQKSRFLHHNLDFFYN